MSVTKALPAELRSDPDRDLADRHRYGDRSAFEEVYSRFSSPVYNVCLRMCGETARAEDLSQEVFLRIYKGLGRFRGQASLKTWVYRITVNHCRSRLGRKRLTVQTFDGQLERCLADDSESPEMATLRRERRRRIAVALLRLPPRFREVVVLRDLEGLSYREIGTVLGARAGTVRSRISRGRERLRDLLEGER